ncbi:MAG TPA: hypothetical protein VGS09_12775 [Actinomycetota bacterium]|jgi:hypothetical protein|nr:hypothetical protein [Actinomycetota bacterium]
MGRTLVAAGSAVTAVLCAWTGFRYLGVVIPPEPGLEQVGSPSVGGWFVTMGLLGAAGLLALGVGQWLAGPRTRLLLLVVLAVVSAGYVAANAFGLYVVRFAGPGNIPAGLHQAGLWLGSILFLGVLLEAMLVIQAQRSLEERVA